MLEDFPHLNFNIKKEPERSPLFVSLLMNSPDFTTTLLQLLPTDKPTGS